MKYVVIESGGKQYRVSEGDIFEVDKLHIEEKADVSFDRVLLMRWDEQVRIGTPHLSDVKVKGKVVAQIKGEKIRVNDFKAKSRHRRTTGFRSRLTRIEITGINAAGIEKKPVKQEEKTEKKQAAPKRERKKAI